MGKKLKNLPTSQIVLKAYEKCNGNVSATARETGLTRSLIYYHLKKQSLKEANERAKAVPLVDGQLDVTPTLVRPVPKKSVKRYIVTSAQNNTRLNDEVWKNLLALRDHYQAEIFIGTYTYNMNAYGAMSVKRGTKKEHQSGLWYDERLMPYIEKADNVNIELAPNLLWCGKANILPTAERPLSGFETYAGRASGIFPHAKIALQSIPVNKHEAIKMNYTTGTVTQRNYIQKKAGLKAEHHHTYGALIVEVDKDGSWFVRQLNADSKGVIHDLDLRVSNGRVETGCRLLAINWGDIHVAQGDEDAYEEAWGEGGILDTLRPEYQFMHDLVDFHHRNHHDIWNHQAMFKRFIQGKESVKAEMIEAARFLSWASRNFCTTVVVDSNHDAALGKWLRDSDFKKDPVNALFYLEAQLAYYDAIANQTPIHMIHWALTKYGCPVETVFLRQDESFILHESDSRSGIECGMHGHLGPNGARGSTKALAKLGRKANTGHTHSAEIIDGLYTSGVTGRLVQGYNVGPSSWSQSHILTYGNGKRAIITRRNNKWRA